MNGFADMAIAPLRDRLLTTQMRRLGMSGLTGHFQEVPDVVTTGVTLEVTTGQLKITLVILTITPDISALDVII